ncbi:predicted protein [Naegleria gruberi]|uniref:Predicted protein n=1 Tax=Naegleria gruberi TaxID=5762 RepID=D2VGD4_NAEGR|nr:uncharacterized protein NAEGRDRAFT_67937 [Naegleria gruberi]EFC44047.1 predicted protein [Naegleria gruberi]|eukprot:XP_002676791.1 predicted protein [Naegleria gruberi strain NEG-M]
MYGQHHHQYANNKFSNNDASNRKNNGFHHHQQQHHVLMEPSICLEPFSNTNELFPLHNNKVKISSPNNRRKPYCSCTNDVCSSTSSLAHHQLYLNNDSLPRQQITFKQHHLHHQHLKEALSSELKNNVQNNQDNEHHTEMQYKTMIEKKTRNGSLDLFGEIESSESNLKRKCARPISPCKKQREDQLETDDDNLLLAERGTLKLPNTRSGANATILHVVPLLTCCSENGALSSPTTLQTSTSTDEQIVITSMMDASMLQPNNNGSHSVNNHSCSSTESSNFSHEDEEDDEALERSLTNSSLTTTCKKNPSFENVEFVTPKRKSNRGRKPKPKKVNVSEGPWTEEEHDLFMLGYEECGKNWSKIADEYVPSRSRTQIASHAQKYFRKQRNKKQ